jgi:DNA repair protein RecO
LNKSESLILRRFRQGESSLVVHAFTRENGRIPFIAKGARSGGKRAQVPLIPVVLLELIWKTSNRSELQLLREASLVNGYGDIHSNFEKLAWAQAAIETLGRTLTGEEANIDLFDLTKKYLEEIENNSTRFADLFQYFRLSLLREMGFEINLEIPEINGNIVYFQSVNGRAYPEKRVGGIRIHLGSWKYLNKLGKSKISEIKRLRISPDASREIDLILDAAYRQAFERWKPMQSLKLIGID